MVAKLWARLPWETMTPFGAAVEPEVYLMVMMLMMVVVVMVGWRVQSSKVCEQPAASCR